MLLPIAKEIYNRVINLPSSEKISRNNSHNEYIQNFHRTYFRNH